MPSPDAGSDIALYIHWPFCRSKCPYCDFNSRPSGDIDHGRWRLAYTADLRRQARRLGPEPRVVRSVYFGGGTPSLMEPRTVEAILAAAADHWTIADDVEISLEANPADIGDGGFSDLKAAGINRISLGVQALDDGALLRLGRRHTVAEALRAVDLAQASVDRVSLDLIYARPGQTAADWLTELERAVALGPDHLSVYQLTLEPGTPMFGDLMRGAFDLPDEDAAADLLFATRDALSAHGFAAYEVSNFARDGHACRHNVAIWRGGDYMGLGPGAHGRLTTPSGPVATVGMAEPDGWCAAILNGESGFEDEMSLPLRDRAVEIVMTGLRLEEGVSERRVRAVTGCDFADLLDTGGLDLAVDLGLLMLDEDRIRATDAGILILNTLTASLLVL